MSVDRSRLDHLRDIAAKLEQRMATVVSDQNFTLMARERRAVLAEIDELGGGVQVRPKETGYSDFERRLREREERTAKGPRRAKSV